MSFLRLLEGLRNPVCDSLLNALTLMGDETVFLVLCLVVFWCVCKQEGYFLLTSGLGGTVTALAVNIDYCPTHIAGMPVAVNMCCHCARHAETTL